MPHIIVKLWPGPTEEQKALLAERYVAEMIEVLGQKDTYISVAIEEVDPSEWAEKVYRPEIAPQMDQLYKKPGYEM